MPRSTPSKGLGSTDIPKFLQKRDKPSERLEVIVADSVGVKMHDVISNQAHVIEFLDQGRSIYSELKPVP